MLCLSKIGQCGNTIRMQGLNFVVTMLDDVGATAVPTHVEGCLIWKVCSRLDNYRCLTATVQSLYLWLDT